MKSVSIFFLLMISLLSIVEIDSRDKSTNKLKTDKSASELSVGTHVLVRKLKKRLMKVESKLKKNNLNKKIVNLVIL